MAKVQSSTADPPVNPHTDDEEQDKEEEEEEEEEEYEEAYDDARNETSAPSRRSLVLKGHTDYVLCLARLADGRLASGSVDTSIIIWSVAEEKQVAKLEGHTESVTNLAALADGWLVSGSGDKTIRVCPMLYKAISRIVACSSAFDIEDAARGFCETNELGNVFVAAMQQAITTQAYVFNAIARVVTDNDNTALIKAPPPLRPRRRSTPRHEAPRRVGRNYRKAHTNGVISRRRGRQIRHTLAAPGN